MSPKPITENTLFHSNNLPIPQTIRVTERAYRQLHTGSVHLLVMDKLYWTEKFLLRLVRNLYRQRLEQLVAVMGKGGK